MMLQSQLYLLRSTPKKFSLKALMEWLQLHQRWRNRYTRWEHLKSTTYQKFWIEEVQWNYQFTIYWSSCHVKYDQLSSNSINTLEDINILCQWNWHPVRSNYISWSSRSKWYNVHEINRMQKMFQIEPPTRLKHQTGKTILLLWSVRSVVATLHHLSATSDKSDTKNNFLKR